LLNGAMRPQDLTVDLEGVVVIGGAQLRRTGTVERGGLES